VDWVCEESRRAGQQAARWLRGERPDLQISAKAGHNVRYVNPARISPKQENHIYLRSMIVKNDAVLDIRLSTSDGGRVVRSKKERHVQPSEMISLTLEPKDFEGCEVKPDSVLEFSIS
jgi:hypothetical protein